MKRIFYVFILLLFAGTISVSAQTTEMDPNDPDVIFTSTNHPSDPGGADWDKVKKWGHATVLSWNPYSYGYKSYIFRGMAFRLKFPKSYQPGVNDGKKYPVYIFLHGLGEPGPTWNNEKSLLWGAQLHAQAVDRGDFDGFVIYPQASGGGWFNSYITQMVALVGKLKAEVKADEDRVIIAGLSSGGSASWSYLDNSPQTWAAITPISAAYNYTTAMDWIPHVITVPVWLANGGQDKSPSPWSINLMLSAYNYYGGDVKQSFYPNLAHNVWNNFWAEPGYFDFLNKAHKAQPLVRFGKTEFCPGETINVSLLLQPGFYQYEWQKDNVTIAGADKDSLVVTEFGTYRGRFKRTSTSDWSDWSPRPVEIKAKASTPQIVVEQGHTNVIPAPNGDVTTPLTLTENYASFDWRRVSDNAQVSTLFKYYAGPGTYTVTVTSAIGCPAVTSAPFTVIDANGANGPDKATDLTATATSNTSIQLNWADKPAPLHNETAFEIYRSKSTGTEYKLIGQVGADILQFEDSNLTPGEEYFYVVRAINDNAAAPLSNEASAITTSDKTPPTIPQNLEVTQVSRHTVTLNWIPSTDESGVKNYDIYINGVKTYSTTKTTFLVNDLDSFVNYSFYVRARDLVDNVSAPSNQATAFTMNYGLNYKVYEGEWTTLPDFSTLTPVDSGVHAGLDISLSQRTENFGMVWEGYIYIPQAATYTFYLESDDGSAMYLDNWYSPGATKFINNDGTHGMTTVSKATTANFPVGYHKVAFTFFQQGGGQGLNIYWKRNKTGYTTKVLIPDMYFRDQATPGGSVPGQPTNLVATALKYDSVKLNWQDGSNNETGFEVYRRVAPADFEMIALVDANVTTYYDTTVAGSTTYEYKVQAINVNGGSGFNQAGVSVTTPDAPAVPDIPHILSLEALSPTSVNIVLSDSSTQTGYEIYRSIGLNNDYRLFKQINTTDSLVNIIDSGLFAHTNVYYKIKAFGVSGFSDFSDEASILTENTAPILTPIRPMSVYYQGTTVLPLTATDADGDNLSFSFSGLPSFVSFTPGENGEGSLTFSTVPANQGLYTFEAFVSDGFEGGDTITLSINVSSNRPPTLSRIPELTVNEGGVLSRKLTAFDADRFTYLKFTLTGQPSFVESRITDAFYIFANPGYSDAGTYNFWVMVWDGAGGYDSSLVTLVVNDAQPSTQRVYVNILDNGTTPIPSTPWNNVVGQNTSSLLDNNGETTGISLNFTTPDFNTTTSGGGTNNQSGIFPDEVIRDNFYFGTAGIPDTIYFTYSGLEAGKRYNLDFFSASDVNSGATVFSVDGRVKSLDFYNNTSETVLFKGVLASASGEIQVKMYKSEGTAIGFLNAMYLEKMYDDGTVPQTPGDLTALTLANGYVKLDWSDKSYNENGFGVLRSESPSGEYTILNSGDYNADETSFIDSSTLGNKTYYYKVFAFNDYGHSDTIGIASAVVGNREPELGEIADVYLKSGESNVINLIATDDAGENLNFSVSNQPPFVTLENTGNGTATLTISPQNGEEGIYKDITVTVTDPVNGAVSRTFLIGVSNNVVRSVYVNIGPDNATAEPGPWNNYLKPAGNTTAITGLLDDRNANTGFTFKFNNPLNGGSLEGMEDGNQGVFSDNVMKSALFVNGTGSYTLQFGGLNVSNKYNIALFSSLNLGAMDSAMLTSGGQSVSINGSYNSTRKIQLNELTPNASGVIQVTINKNAASSKFYINALVLEEYTGTQLLAPADLVAQPTLSTDSILLTWTDRTNSETGYEVWRSETISGGYTKIATISTANTWRYVDKTSSLTPGTVYYYKVRAYKTSPTTYSEYSNVVRFGLAKNLVLFNMNTNAWGDMHQAAPWNNLDELTSGTGVTVTDLINTNFQNTSYDFQITQGFNGIGWVGVKPGIMPDNVMESTVWCGSGQVSSIKFSNLNYTKRYRLGVMSSINDNSEPYVGIITVNNMHKKINANLNAAKVIYFDNVAPDANGEVYLSITPELGSTKAFVSAFTLESFDKPSDSYFPTDNLRGGNATERGRVGGIVLMTGNNESAAPVKEIGLSAYPNPAISDLFVNIQLPDEAKDAVIEMYDITGRKLLRKSFSGIRGSNLMKLTFSSSFAPGNYILKLTAKGNVKTMIVVKKQ